jgi:alpha-glucosidase
MSFFGGLLSKKKTDVEYMLSSPNGRVKAYFVLAHGKMSYRIHKDTKTILRNSNLGLKLKNNEIIGENLASIRVHSRYVDDKWETIYGEERIIQNNYKEAAFYLEDQKTKRLITVRFRAFNDGIAFRYEIPPNADHRRMTVLDELTEFAVDVNSHAWQIPAYKPDRYEYSYEKKSVHELVESVHTPLTIQTTSGHFISIHEAALYNYGSATIKLDDARALKIDITPMSDGVKAEVELPFSTPWRTVVIGHNAIDLTLSRIMLNLNDPPTEDMSWVEPTKFMGIWWAMFVGEWTWASGERHGATTEHSFQYIDACKKFGIPALLVEGWNDAWEGDWLENGAHNKFMEPYPDFDIEAVAKYAKKNGIDLVGHHETVGFIDNYEKQLPAAYEYLKDFDVRYIKSGYAGSMMDINGKREYHHSQLGVRHYQKVLEMAAKYKIMLNIHEPIKSTGIERTWPNLLTREGARGQEYEGGALSPSHMCILPFTRLLAGGMDYTPGIFDVTNFSKRLASTLARQLAYYVIIYSGMQMVADRPRIYEEHMDAFKFIQDVPINWEKTIPLLGEIGEYYVVARKDRATPDWYVGGVTNEAGRQVRVILDFLEGEEYIAEIYRDGDDAHFRDHQTSIAIEEKRVTKSDELDIYIAPGGGFAIRLRKA